MTMFATLGLVAGLKTSRSRSCATRSARRPQNCRRIEGASTPAAGAVRLAEQISRLKALENRYPGLDRISVSLSVGVTEIGRAKSSSLRHRNMPAFAATSARTRARRNITPLPHRGRRVLRHRRRVFSAAEPANMQDEAKIGNGGLHCATPDPTTLYRGAGESD